MFQSLGDASVTGGEILGGKTGYTEEAGLCLASLAQVNGREYILVGPQAHRAAMIPSRCIRSMRRRYTTGSGKRQIMNRNDKE